MKILNSIFLFSTCFLSGFASAADLYVRDLGAGGAYPTISAAISAANDGDRIIVRPKTGNTPYLEDLAINKSLTFVSEINFTKYYVQGNIIITPAAGRTVTINNMYAFQSSISTSTTSITGGRATVNLLNCTVGNNIDLDNSRNVTANVSFSSCKSLYLVHGKIIGNTMLTLGLTDDAAPLASGDIYIIANNIMQDQSNYIGVGISVNTSSYPFNIFNNNMSSQINASLSTVASALKINIIKAGSSNTIQNNSMYISNSSSSGLYDAAIYIQAPSAGAITINNNIISNAGTNSIDYEILKSTGNSTVIANNNLSPNQFYSGNIIANGSISNGVYSIDLATGVSTGAVVNAGLADEEFQDLDLTRNDIGPVGGSNSWLNYFPLNSGNKPRVAFLNTPRRVYNGTTNIQIEATGISR